MSDAKTYESLATAPPGVYMDNESDRAMPMHLYSAKDGSVSALVVAQNPLQAETIAQIELEMERPTVALVHDDKVLSIKADTDKVVGTALDMVMDHMASTGKAGIYGSTEHD